MKNSLLLCAIGAVVALTPSVGLPFAVNRSASPILNSAAGTSLAFTKNVGQWPDSILFRACANGATLWFTRDGIYYQYFHRIGRTDSNSSPTSTGRLRQSGLLDRLQRERDSVETMMVKTEFVGASDNVEVEGLAQLKYKCNYFVGNDRARWRTDVPNYSGVILRGLYPGVDVVYRGRGGKFEYELVSASPSQIAVNAGPKVYQLAG